MHSSYRTVYLKFAFSVQSPSALSCYLKTRCCHYVRLFLLYSYDRHKSGIFTLGFFTSARRSWTEAYAKTTCQILSEKLPSFCPQKSEGAWKLLGGIKEAD